MPPLETPLRFQTALQLTRSARLHLRWRLSSPDIASQLAPPQQRSLWFELAGGTAALLSWRMWGWILRRVDFVEHPQDRGHHTVRPAHHPGML